MVDQLVKAVEEYMETYTHDVDDVDTNLIMTIAEDFGVNPTAQVVDVVTYRIQQMHG